MVVKHRHPAISRMRKELDKIENEIAEKTADRVVHELKESKKHEHKEHSKHCKCVVHRKKSTRKR